MSLTVVVEPEVEAEIIESANWYEQQNPVARRRFITAVDWALHLIEEGPEQYQVVYRDVRRVLVDDFPYAIFYRVTETEIIIVSCFHTSRYPQVWRDRLP